MFTEAVGALAGWLTRDGTAIYGQTIVQPPPSPPPWVFPSRVGSSCYALMGIGAARICMQPAFKRETHARAGAVCLVQLGFNFFWSILFLQPAAVWGLALLVAAPALWALILWMILALSPGRPAVAARLQIPYLLWVSFAAYLNLGFGY